MSPTPRRVHPDVLPPVVSPAEADGGGHALTASDRGRLPEGTRRTLVALLQGPYLARELHSNLWPVLIADEPLIRERLGDLLLDLVLDQELGVSFVRPMQAEGMELPKTMRTVPLTFIDTVVLLFLRERLLRSAGERVYVGRDEIDEHCDSYRANDETNVVLFRKRVNAAVSKLKANSILRGTREEDRLEISPVLGLVFDAEAVRTVIAELRTMADGGADGNSARQVDEDPEVPGLGGVDVVEPPLAERGAAS